MPRIQEYQPEQEAAGPQGAIQPNLELATQAGRGLENLGRDINDAGDKLYSRQAQLEEGNAFADVSEKKVDDADELQQGVADGTWDNDKYKENFTDWQNQQVETYTTAAGKNAFMRQSNRMLGSMLTRGNRGQAIIAQKNAVSNWNETLDNNATATFKDPTTFDDNLHSVMELVSNLPVAAQKPALEQAQDTLAKQAILGANQTDPNLAAAYLKDAEFSSHLKPNTLDELQTHIEHSQEFALGAPERARVLEEKKEKAVVSKYFMDNLDAIQSGAISPQDAYNNPVLKTPEAKLLAASFAERSQRLFTSTSPAVKSDVVRRLNLPAGDPDAFTDVTQVISVPGLAPKDAALLSKQYFSTPAGESEKENMRYMMNDVKGKLTVTNMPDPEKNNRISNAHDDFQKAKAALISAGKDWHPLIDPKSPDYFPNTVRAPNPMDLMKAAAAQYQTGQLAVEKPIIYTTPGVIPPTTKPPALGPDESIRMSKDGRQAVFNNSTKSFSHWVDAPISSPQNNPQKNLAEPKGKF